MKMSDRMLDEAARRFALLGDPTRLRILATMLESGEMPVGALAATTGVSRTNLSQHLGKLAAAGLVGRRRCGNEARYRVTDDSLPRICDLVCAAVQSRAAALTP